VGVRAGLPALVIGTFLSIYSLIPEAAVSSLSYLLLSIISLFGAIIGVILLSSLPVYFFFMRRSDLTVSEFSS